jgi:sulfofructose kinase
VDEGSPIEDLDLGRVQVYAPALAMLARRYPGAAPEIAMRAARDAGAAEVVTTLGADGVRTLDETGEARIPAYATDVVSTLGAGDVFHGALIAALVDGRPLREAAAWASVVAALSCAGLDGRSAIPTRESADRAFAGWAAARAQGRAA